MIEQPIKSEQVNGYRVKHLKRKESINSNSSKDKNQNEDSNYYEKGTLVDKSVGHLSANPLHKYVDTSDSLQSLPIKSNDQSTEEEVVEEGIHEYKSDKDGKTIVNGISEQEHGESRNMEKPSPFTTHKNKTKVKRRVSEYSSASTLSTARRSSLHSIDNLDSVSMESMDITQDLVRKGSDDSMKIGTDTNISQIQQGKPFKKLPKIESTIKKQTDIDVDKLDSNSIDDKASDSVSGYETNESGSSHEGIHPGQKLTARQAAITARANATPRSNTLTSGANSDPSDEGDAVNVVVRVRPISELEKERHDKNIIQFPGDGALWIDTGYQTKSFTFNVTFEPEAKQEDVFTHSGVKKLIEMALNGYSCTAFAFGQTGSGKTHTITGPPEMFEDGHLKTPPEYYGLIPRSFHYLFQLMKQQPRSGFRITTSYLEIYNEQVQDLLNPNVRRNLAVRWSKNKGFYVENLFHLECESIEDLMAVLEEGI